MLWVHVGIFGWLLKVSNLLLSLINEFEKVFFYISSSTWKVIAFCCVPPCCVLFISLLFLPETPYWLVEQNQLDKATESLKFFRGPNYDIAHEIDEIHQKHLSKDESQSFIWIFKRMFSSAFLKPFLCNGVLRMFFALCGFDILNLFMIQILTDTGSSVDPKLGPVIVGSVRMFLAGKYILHAIQSKLI